MRMAEARAYAYDNVRSQKCQRREPRTYTPSAGSRRADRMAPIADFRKYRQHRRSLSDNGVPSTAIACRPGSWAQIFFWPRPRAPFSHEVPHARGHRIDIDDDRDRGATICLVGARETETAEDFLHVVDPCRRLLRWAEHNAMPLAKAEPPYAGGFINHPSHGSELETASGDRRCSQL